ncbi:DUF3443 family protein [Paraburkholderia sp. NMBU_R16]|nr:DUF3443 family protein [Paraburkholderia sp. NMBU_R16]
MRSIATSARAPRDTKPRSPSRRAISSSSMQFFDGYTWGPVRLVDVKISGETANALPVQLIGRRRAVLRLLRLRRFGAPTGAGTGAPCGFRFGLCRRCRKRLRGPELRCGCHHVDQRIAQQRNRPHEPSRQTAVQ